MKKLFNVNYTSLLNNCRLCFLCFAFLLPVSVLANTIDTNKFIDSKSIEMVSINNATVKELTSLKGVGKVKAQAIVNFRKEYGSFTSLNSLTKVKGIGEKVLIENKNKLTL